VEFRSYAFWVDYIEGIAEVRYLLCGEPEYISIHSDKMKLPDTANLTFT
jgi:hypothetical protein